VVPVITKAIEIMMEPKALRQRAELIENTDLSAEALLQGMSTAAFSKKIMTLFRSYDVNSDGLLDQDEFISCLQALELQLSKVEMLALFDAADVKHTVSERARGS
jgi:Ca2+-binding EF-hand superfamily protein